MKITLIGMPGSGKSTIGRFLADTLGYKFIDLDEVIESSQNANIVEIFQKEGESGFRQIESVLLKEALEGDSNAVLASGGGAPCFHDGIRIINEESTSVYLQTSIESLKLNISRSEDNRPLLSGELESKLVELLKTRSNVYEGANLIIKTDGHEPMTICQNIISHLDLA